MSLKYTKTWGDNMKEFKLPETKDIDGVEIFASGTWNGDKYTDKDLDELVNNFTKTKDSLKPFLKLGHTEKQKLAQTDGLPSLGYVENLRRVGSKLVADFKNVPSKIFDLIEKGAYSRVSSEIFINLKVMGQKVGKALKAVALLGGDTPAVQSLGDIMALYSKEDLEEFEKMYASGASEARAYDQNQETVVVCADVKKMSKEDTKMDEMQKLKADLVELQKKYSEATDELVQYKDKEAGDMDKMKKKMKELEEANKALKGENDKFKKKNNELEADVKVHADKAVSEEINRKLDKLIEDKKISPAQREQAFSLLMDAKQEVSEKKYKLGEKEVSKEEFVLSFFDQNKIDVHTDEETGHAKFSADTDPEDAKIQKYMSDNKCDYKSAMLALGGSSESK